MPTINCDPQALVTAAEQFQCCIPDGMQMAVQTYLLAVIAGGSLDPQVLARAAECFKCLDGMQAEVQTYLLCQILNLPEQ